MNSEFTARSLRVHAVTDTVRTSAGLPIDHQGDRHATAEPGRPDKTERRTRPQPGLRPGGHLRDPGLPAGPGRGAGGYRPADRAGRADPGRERAAEPGHVRYHVDGTGSADADGRML